MVRTPHRSLVIVAGVALSALAAAQPPPDPFALLQQYVGTSGGGAAALRRGQAISRTVSTSDKREVAIFGAVAVDVPKGYYVERLRDIERFKRDSMVLAVGRFGDPPRIEDLARLTLDRRDLDALEECEVGDCDVRLPAAAILRFRREVNWKGRDAPQVATALFREILLATVEAYRAGGNAALSAFHDRRRPVSNAEEFAALLQQPPGLAEHFPAFREHLQHYPARALPGVEDFLYWSKETFGFKPVISITHVSVLRDGASAQGGSYLIASKQIYASHYFDASLALTVLADPPPDDTAAPHRFYLMYLNRSRVSVFGGLFGGLARAAVQGRTRETMVKTLREVKSRLEREYPHGAGSAGGR